MADYWLTFRIADYGHPERYDDLIATLNDLGTGFWSEPTSFVCIRSAHSIDTIGKRIAATLDTTQDLLVLREIGKDNTRYAGEPEEGFRSFFPSAKKL